jgi:hypothetical protein
MDPSALLALVEPHREGLRFAGVFLLMLAGVLGVAFATRSVQQRAAAQEGPLWQAVARALYLAVAAQAAVALKGLDLVEDRLHAIQVAELAKRIYAALPGTIHVRFRGLSVPVPFKDMFSEAQFVDLVTKSFAGVANSLDLFEEWVRDVFEEYERMGVSERSLLAGASPVGKVPAAPRAVAVGLKRLLPQSREPVRMPVTRDVSRYEERRRKIRASYQNAARQRRGPVVEERPK